MLSTLGSGWLSERQPLAHNTVCCPAAGQRLSSSWPKTRAPDVSNCFCDYAGCGVNVTNKDPTVCINDILQHVNDLESRSRSEWELFTVEEVIAKSVSVLEQLIEKFETDRHMILDQYYKYWLHRQVVTVSLIDVASSFINVVMSIKSSVTWFYYHLVVRRPNSTHTQWTHRVKNSRLEYTRITCNSSDDFTFC